MKCRESDYAGQYSPWSCETIGSYIGTKDAKPKDIMISGTMEMMVSSDDDPSVSVFFYYLCRKCKLQVSNHLFGSYDME